jgi:hypothetical protein
VLVPISRDVLHEGQWAGTVINMLLINKKPARAKSPIPTGTAKIVQKNPTIRMIPRKLRMNPENTSLQRFVKLVLLGLLLSSSIRV